MQLSLNNVSFYFETASQVLFTDLNIHFPAGWTGIIGSNGSGKTTLLRLVAGELAPVSGDIHCDGGVVYCSQRTDDAPKELESMLFDTDRLAHRLRGQLDVGDDFATRWDTLSHGERKRAQLAVALWQNPLILAVDEPTNHLDSKARYMVQKALGSFKGLGLLVSHDRELLDQLCAQCLFTSPPSATMRPGNYTQATAQAAVEQKNNERLRTQTKKEVARLRRSQINRRQEASTADSKRSKKHIAPKDHDAKERIGRARNTGKDGYAGKLTRQMDGRMRQLTEKLSQTHVEKKHRVGVQMQSKRTLQRTLLSLNEGTIQWGECCRLAHPALFIGPDDRIGITGDNGAGKSTLIAHILSQLRLTEAQIVYVPQEIDAQSGARIVYAVRALSSDMQGKLFTIVNRLGTRPERLLETDMPSPGELRKVLLALGIIKSPSIIVMDEPTNHLDLPAVLALEAALDECAAALLLVSHDLRFLKRLAEKQWHIEDGELTEMFFGTT